MEFSFLRRMTIAGRLAVAFALVLGVCATAAGVAWWEMKDMKQRMDQLVAVNGAKLWLLDEMSQSVLVVSRVLRTAVLMTDRQEVEVELKKVAVQRQRYDDAWTRLQGFPAAWGPLSLSGVVPK